MEDENDRIIAERQLISVKASSERFPDPVNKFLKEDIRPKTFFARIVLDTFRCAVVILCHTILMGIFAGCIYCLEIFLIWLFGTIDPKLFDFLRLRYMFDAVDVVVFVLLAISVVSWLRQLIWPSNEANSARVEIPDPSP